MQPLCGCSGEWVDSVLLTQYSQTLNGPKSWLVQWLNILIEVWGGRDITSPPYFAKIKTFHIKMWPIAVHKNQPPFVLPNPSMFYELFHVRTIQSSSVVHHEFLWCHLFPLQCSNPCSTSVRIWRTAEHNSHSHLQPQSWWPESLPRRKSHLRPSSHFSLPYCRLVLNCCYCKLVHVINNCDHLQFN